MDETEFRELLKDYVLPLFPGAVLGVSETSTKQEDCVAYRYGTLSIAIKPTKETNYRVIISRSQDFSHDERDLVAGFIEEIEKVISSALESQHINLLMLFALERAICRSISIDAYIVLAEIIQAFEKWSQRTYEGRAVPFGCMINLNEKSTDNPALYLPNIISQDFAALLSDGIDSWLVLDSGGHIGLHESINVRSNEEIMAPFRFAKIANMAIDKRVAIVLLSNGEILIFKDQEIRYAKRRGAWRSFNHESVIRQIAAKSKFTKEETRRAMYKTCLDVSFTRTGGTLAYLWKSREAAAIENHIDDKDLIDSDDIKSAAVRELIPLREFHSIPRKLRQELAGIDGATVLNSEGQIITVGSIIKIEAGSPGGARQAAARTLSKYGIAIKVSSDGMIEGYYAQDADTYATQEPIFTIA